MIPAPVMIPILGKVGEIERIAHVFFSLFVPALFRERKKFCVSSARFELALREFCSAIFEIRKRALFYRFLSLLHTSIAADFTRVVRESQKATTTWLQLGPSLVQSSRRSSKKQPFLSFPFLPYFISILDRMLSH